MFRKEELGELHTVNGDNRGAAFLQFEPVPPGSGSDI